MKHHFYFSLFLLFAGASNNLITAQAIDSVEVEKKVRREINPKRSIYYSLALPGLGQVYNGRWWKVPFVYGAIGGVVFAIDYNTRQYKRLNTALNLKRNNEEHEFTGTSIDNVRSLQSIRDGFDKNRQLSYIGLVAVYALQAVEAFVDGHLQNFDISDDLSLKIKPTFEQNNALGQSIIGIGVQIPIGTKIKSREQTEVTFPAF